jgi:uncharacterized membrane protein YccC
MSDSDQRPRSGPTVSDPTRWLVTVVGLVISAAGLALIWAGFRPVALTWTSA